MFIDRSSIYKNNFIKDNEEIKYNTKKILEIKRKNYINLNENVYYEILRKKYEEKFLEKKIKKNSIKKKKEKKFKS
jgi:hypothetical protein